MTQMGADYMAVCGPALQRRAAQYPDPGHQGREPRLAGPVWRQIALDRTDEAVVPKQSAEGPGDVGPEFRIGGQHFIHHTDPAIEEGYHVFQIVASHEIPLPAPQEGLQFGREKVRGRYQSNFGSTGQKWGTDAFMASGYQRFEKPSRDGSVGITSSSSPSIIQRQSGAPSDRSCLNPSARSSFSRERYSNLLPI
jgi:hypothetical protein